MTNTITITGDIDSARSEIAKVAEKFGLNVEWSGAPMTPDFRTLKAMYPKIAGRTFTVPYTGTVKIIGYRASNFKYPVIYQKGGKTYKGPRSILDGCTPENDQEAAIARRQAEQEERLKAVETRKQMASERSNFYASQDTDTPVVF